MDQHGGRIGSSDDGERHRKVAAAAKTWTGQLVDLTGRNGLLFYKDLRLGTVDLGGEHADAVAVEELLAGRQVRLSTVFPGDALAPAAKRVRTIAAKAKENFEEKGLQTAFIVLGMATWKNASGTATPAAPVLLRPVAFNARGGAAEDFDVTVDGDWVVNPTLLHLLDAEHGVSLASDDLLELVDVESPGGIDPLPIFEYLTKAAVEVGGFGIAYRVVIGNFSYAKLPLVRDIEEAAASGALEAHDLLAAIAGDEGARAAIRSRHPEVRLDDPDLTPPADEFLVVDADSSQSFATNAVARGGDLVIEGPPGTGKSQTIVNLIATLAARGKRVLFVAEKRAAIDAVLDRLTHVGLRDLVLDLHDGAGSRRQLAQDLAKAMNDHASVLTPDVAANHEELTRRRTALRTRADALHRPRAPWGLSIYDVQSRLIELGDGARSSARLRGPVLAALDGDAHRPAREELRQYIELGGASIARGASPWTPAFMAGTITTSDQSRAAMEDVVGLADQSLPTTTQRLDRVLAECGLDRPSTIDGWSTVFTALDDVASLLGDVDEGVFGLALGELIQALDPAKRGAVGRMWAGTTDSSYRAAKVTVAAHWRSGKASPHDLLEAVTRAEAALRSWRSLASNDGTPRLPTELPDVRSSYESLSHDLRAMGAWLSTGLEGRAAEEVSAELARLREDETTLYRLPELHRLGAALRARGLGALLDEAVLQALSVEEALARFDHAWLSGVLDAVSHDDLVIGAFDGGAHDRTVRDFVDSDRRHIGSAAARIRRAVAEHAVRTRDDHPEESSVVERQARLRRGHLSARHLFQRAPNVLGAMKPCWAMSPLVVAQLLPAERCFDVVVFDEGSQVTPADAVGALLRADRAVVAGDTKQLPPSNFFASSSSEEEADDEDDDALTHGLESILDVMGALLPPPTGSRTLAWHYRSRDERLIAFSNAQPTLYDWSLTTFPGVSGGECFEHVHAPWRPGTLTQGGSSPDEVEEVVRLVLDHARRRPDESLGVIAMGIKHAQRIEEVLRRARASHPELDPWFDRGPGDEGKEPFFVKNLERVQGDERDAIILTIGYGKSADGRMQYRFGPVNNEGGERRLNVAITRARSRMTVVSSFTSADMDPKRLNSEGARMLAGYLAYAESGGTDFGQVARRKGPLNPFERDVQDRLSKAGIPLEAQFGASGYWIDYAAQHPSKPGRMVLAIECDGASYHSSPTARDRDRLRQEHLERLGWSFHRIWSTDWFRKREREVSRALEAYRVAVQRADTGAQLAAEPSREVSAKEQPAAVIGSVPVRPGPRPSALRRAGQPIDAYSAKELVELIRWLESDGLLRTEEELLTEAVRELGYKRRGARIVAALTTAIADARG